MLPPSRNISNKSKNCPRISPTITTGANTGTKLFSSTKISFAFSHSFKSSFSGSSYAFKSFYTQISSIFKFHIPPKINKLS